MREFRRLTSTQTAYIQRLRKWKLRVDFKGIDAVGDPVFEVEDSRRSRLLAAFPEPIPAIAGEPAMPIRELTEEEVEAIPHPDFCILMNA